MIEVGGTYARGDTRFEGAYMVFVVVERAVHYEGSTKEYPSPGFLALIIMGTHKSSPWTPEKGPGDTFTCASSSAVACDSVRFPAEE